MSGEIDFETVCKKIESMGAESCSGIFQNFRFPKLEAPTHQDPNLRIIFENRTQTFRLTFTGKNFSKNTLIQKSSLPYEIQGRGWPFSQSEHDINGESELRTR